MGRRHQWACTCRGIIVRIVGEYPFNNGSVIRELYPHLVDEVEAAINSVYAEVHRTKRSKEKTMVGRMLYNPASINASLQQQLYARRWKKHKVYCEYPTEYYIPDYTPHSAKRSPRPYREIDFLKDNVGIEVQFGKYSFMVYNVCAKMTIFHNMGYIEHGIEVVPVKSFADEMSTGVSYFEQFVWDLSKRGVGDIDIPVLILGIDENDANEEPNDADTLIAHDPKYQKLTAEQLELKLIEDQGHE